ncbi:hypothetical protein RIF29_15457 [Crotalaria pallida]|uniref:Uncharacterized protein n=1 Tax=Crotalaria pallida TaxID=3830 RepID=A0AAN9ICL7_CROPI
MRSSLLSSSFTMSSSPSPPYLKPHLLGSSERCLSSHSVTPISLCSPSASPPLYAASLGPLLSLGLHPLPSVLPPPSFLDAVSPSAFSLRRKSFFIRRQAIV